MQIIAVNSVIQYITDEGEVFYERVLWLDASTDSIVVFNLDDNGLPIWKNLSDIQSLLDNKYCKLVDYKSKLLAIFEEDLSEAEKNDYEKAWEVIKNIVIKEPEIYMEKPRGEMVRQAIEEHSVYKNYVYRKLRAYWKNGKVKNALIPQNFNKGAKGKIRKATDAKRGRPFKDETCNNIGMNITDDVKEIFKKAYKKFYNNTKKMSLQLAYYKMLEYYFNIEIVTNSMGNKTIKMPEGDEIPSFGAFKYWYKKLNNIKDTIISRQGTRDSELNHKAVLGESTSESYNPGSMFQVDATIADIYLVSRDNRNWIIGRPVLYIVIDVFSRLIVGFYVGLEGPSWMGAMMALYNTARNKVDLCREYGIEIEEEEWNCSNLPEALVVDRGELESTKPYNLANNLGINVKVLPPYRANWKGIVEQSFRKFNNKTIHWLSGSVKKEYRIRGDRDYRKDSLFNLYEFTQIIIHSILYFNNSYMDYYPRDEQMLADDVCAIPSVLWEWGIKKKGGLLKEFPEDIVKLNLMPTERASITYRGLQFKKLRYSNPEDIETGVYESARKYGSKRVKISYDPRNLEYVYVNEGLSYKKYTLLDSLKSHLFKEEVEFLNKQTNFEKRNREKQKIADTTKLNSNVEAIVKKAKKEARKQDAIDNKNVKNIKENRRDERTKNRETEQWELGKDTNPKEEGKVVPMNKQEDDSYVPPPSYIDILDDDDK